jgi:hypothetical protein
MLRLFLIAPTLIVRAYLVLAEFNLLLCYHQEKGYGRLNQFDNLAHNL